MGNMTVKGVEKLLRERKPGARADGNGLYLKITPAGSASWQIRYQIDGTRRSMGLGSCQVVGLAEARQKALEARRLIQTGKDPLNSAKAADAGKTFDDLAAEHIASHRTGWRNAKHAAQWEATLKTYASPIIGTKRPEDITTDDVVRILKPIWTEKPETATRVRGRIESVIDGALALGLRTAANPARWRGHLDKLLPKRGKQGKAHHPAMPYADLPAFYQRLCEERNSLSAEALKITILSACRTSEVLLARWDEFDLGARLWTIPGDRMKAGREHRVPLSDAALKLIQGLPTREGYLFPGARIGRPLSNMAMTMVLRKLGHADLTVHGFRSTFRDWAAEETAHPNIVAEMVLAHTLENKVEAAYRRGDLLEKRRRLMQDWADYCTKEQRNKTK